MPDHSIASLGLNIKEAEKGNWRDFLPENWKACSRTYSLPHDPLEIGRIAALPIPHTSQLESARYIRRCVKRHKQNIRNQQFRTIKFKESEARNVTTEIHAIRTQAKHDTKKILDEVRVEAAKAAATLTDLYGLARSGSREIMEAFVEGREIEGKKVTPEQFTAVMGKIFSQVAKLGAGALADPDAKGEAERVVFEEAVAATRARLAKTQGSKVKGPEKEQ